MEIFSRNDGEERMQEIPIAMSDTVDHVLRRLVDRPID